jgi:hypothetical protein
VSVSHPVAARSRIRQHLLLALMDDPDAAALMKVRQSWRADRESHKLYRRGVENVLSGSPDVLFTPILGENTAVADAMEPGGGT